MSEMPTAPPVAPPQSNSDRTVMLVLAYLGILALIPLLVKKDDNEVQWHSKNGLVLFGAWFVFWLGVTIVTHFVPFFGCIAAPFGCILAIAYLALTIVLILKAIKGERMRLPVLSDIADKM